ncbi:CTP synthase family protein isoform 1 [Hibiscus syriacus]|uniref:CTP synthase family protein isoform 1 n=1 Tax=Hibiscus syriacus TaxID=106335 RepID=A0A6A2X7G6_HIBSY|nr:CTP synthase family protein isoform 1 [Hibiscus syriacus]
MKLKKNGGVGRRAWGLLRLALLWARKGGVFKRRLMMELRLVPKFLKGLGHSTMASHACGDRLHYKERQFSLNETPIIFVKTVHRSASMRRDSGSTKSCSTCSNIVEDEGEEEEWGYEGCDEKSPFPVEEEGIDSKAEKFIAKFFEEMKLQRQTSDLEYSEMLRRGASY